MKTSRTEVDLQDTGERWILLILAVLVVAGLAMLPT
jgi:hypothetical protein